MSNPAVRRLSALTAAGAISALALTGCALTQGAAPSTSEDPIKIAFLTASSANTWLAVSLEAMQEDAAAEGVEIVEFDGKFEPGVQPRQIQDIITRVQTGFTSVGEEINAVAKAATSNLSHCDMVIAELSNLAKGVDLSSTDLKQADDRVARLLDLSERLIELIAGSGVETSDSPLIRIAIDTAKQIAAAFETGLARSDISLAQLMDEKYREIPGTNPKQYLTDYVAFTDKILPPIQDPIQKIDPRIVFCVAWAKGGYLPTHNPNYRLPQGADPVWNNANCRNRRLFNDRAVHKVAANTKPFLLQTYRRDMGGGNFVLMKDVSSPIYVRGRHWGAFRIGFRQS